MISIVSFLNYIQEKNCGKAEKCRSSRGRKFDGVRNGLEAGVLRPAVTEVHTY
jgi:hypothetical protein